jgi:ppGpp synthetase/RelA/SpoT-type nucleotidyltranferase
LENEYRFSLVALRQPTFLYSIEKTRMSTAGTILGKEVMKELVGQSIERMRFRLKKLREINAKLHKEKAETPTKGFRLQKKIVLTSYSEMGEKLDRQFE